MLNIAFSCFFPINYFQRQLPPHPPLESEAHFMIYLLEDDDSIRKLVVYGLESQGYEAQGFALPSEFWRAMDAQPQSFFFWTSCCPRRTV